MGRWVRVARVRDVPAGTGRTVLAHGKRLALFHDGDGFYALDDLCPHRGASLGEGILLNGVVICPWHQWTFDVRTGVNPRAPEIGVPRYAARCDGEAIEIEIPDDPAGPDGVERT